MTRTFAAFSAPALLAAALAAQTLQPPFAGVYTFASLGPVPGLPAFQSALCFPPGDVAHLLIAADADRPGGAVYRVPVARDAQGHVTGYAGTATFFAATPFIDDGLQYGPGGVLFFTAYPGNTLGQLRPGSTAPDRSIALAPFGMTGSVGALSFVPAGNRGEGELALASYDTGLFRTFTLSPAANGTYDVAAARGPVTLAGGPEGLFYVPPGSRLLPDRQHVLVTEFNTGQLALVPLDAQGLPMPGGRQPFLTGLAGPEGSVVDPLTGDLLLGLYAGGLVVVRGFGVCGECVAYGSGLPGSTGVPVLQGTGCFGRGASAALQVTGGVASAPGLLAFGVQEPASPLGGVLWLVPLASELLLLDAAGQGTRPLAIPAAPALNQVRVLTQAVLLDAHVAAGWSATAALRLTLR